MSAPSSRRVAAVVLNFRTPWDTVLAVRSLQGQSRPPNALLVIDNASGDGSADILRRMLRGPEIVESHQNLGYSGGCNLGIQRALDRGAEAVLLVNGDVMLGRQTLERLERRLDNPAVGVVGPVLLNRHDPMTIDAAGLTFRRFSGRMKVRAAGRPYEAHELQKAAGPAAVMGCVMLVAREVFDRVGLLDEPYFFSFEDIDLCLRAAAAGWRTEVVEEAMAYHAGSLSIGPGSRRRIYYATRNHLRCARRVAPVPWPLGLARAKLIAAFNLAHALRGGWGGPLSSLAAWSLGVWHHLKRRYGAGPED